MESKWNMFRNFMYNEIGITKNDIRTWIREAVQDEVKVLTRQTFGKYSVQDMISTEIKNEIHSTTRYGLKDQLCHEIGKLIIENIEFKNE